MKKIISLFILSFSFLFISNLYADLLTPGFVNPYGIAIDYKEGFIYISNVNGDLELKDDNGFISRLKLDGTVDNLMFFDGKSNKVELNAPKGMVVLGDYLYVCDIDNIRVFSIKKQKHIFDVNFGDLPIGHFYDIVIGPDGALYAADANQNRIYRIDVGKQYEVTLFIDTANLGFPVGLIWYPAKNSFIVIGGESGILTAYDTNANSINIPIVFLKKPRGIVSDEGGNIYVSDAEFNSIFRIAADFTLNSFQNIITKPTGLCYHMGQRKIIMVSFEENAVQMFSAY